MTVPLANRQEMLKFAMCISGFRGIEGFYSGFCTSRIEMPRLQVMGVLNGMVGEEHV